MVKDKLKLKILLTITLVSLIVALIINPPRYIQSVQNGFILFATTVLPALFPFFFFTKILTSIGTASLFASLFKSPAKHLYNAPPSSAYIFVMSMLSGYPIGAKLTSDFYTNGLITASEAKTISSFASTSGPLFILGTVASFMFQNAIIGYILIVSHYLGAILNGLLYKNRGEASSAQLIEENNFDNLLSDAVSNSISSILIVGAYIAIFSMIVDFFYDIGVIKFICNTLENLHIPYKITEAIFVSFIEITRGLMLLSKCGINQTILVPIACALISFGGLSITLQSLTFLSKCKISALRYFCTKTTQAIISFIICLLICLIFI